MLFGCASVQEDGRNLPVQLRRRAERIGSAPERAGLLASYRQLELMLKRASTGACHSLSRRGAYYAVAVSDSGAVGVDIERIICSGDLAAVAECYFPEGVRRYFNRLSVSEQPQFFASCWSALEAVSKLYSIPLEQAASSLPEAVIYQCRVQEDMVLSVALEQSDRLHLCGLAGETLQLARSTFNFTVYP